jgi:hypothetical protein
MWDPPVSVSFPFLSSSSGRTPPSLSSPIRIDLPNLPLSFFSGAPGL